MLIGHVSDEMHYAVPDALVEMRGADVCFEMRSSASGAIRGDVPSGDYVVVISKEGFGRKRERVVIAGDHDPLHFRLVSDRLYGYMSPKAVRAGDTADMRIHASTGFTASLWRYGWEREHVVDLGEFDDHPPESLRQLLPDGDVARDGVQWGRYGYSFPAIDPRLTIEAPQTTGLYYIHLKDRRGRFFTFPWVVAPARPKSRMAVLASNITWNAYNDFGGRSNYVAAKRLPALPTINAHQEDVWFTDPALQPWDADRYEPLSFDRPEPYNSTLEHETITDPIVTRGAEHLAPAEWRLLGWMERQGFDYDFYAETQLADGVLDLDAYQVIVLSTHPEYWTREMYFRLKAWVLAGGKLAYLGGNGINCEVELLADEKMVVLNEDHRKRPLNFESRFGVTVEPEANLLGVVTTHTGYETGAPYRLLVDGHWAFAGTGLERGDEFGHRSVDRRAPGGASGHETDKRTPSTPPQAQLLAKGTNPDGGGAEMVHITHPGGGEVFSVGSISYTCSVAVDDAVSEITGNVLRRFLA